jgi:hypothetical protein
MDLLQWLSDFTVERAEFAGPQSGLCLCAYFRAVFFFLDEIEVKMAT